MVHATSWTLFNLSLWRLNSFIISCLYAGVSDRCWRQLESLFSIQLPYCVVLACFSYDSVISFDCTSLHKPASSPTYQRTHECTCTQTTAAATHGSNAVLICSRIHRAQAWCTVFCWLSFFVLHIYWQLKDSKSVHREPSSTRHLHAAYPYSLRRGVRDEQYDSTVCTISRHVTDRAEKCLSCEN